MSNKSVQTRKVTRYSSKVSSDTFKKQMQITITQFIFAVDKEVNLWQHLNTKNEKGKTKECKTIPESLFYICKPRLQDFHLVVQFLSAPIIKKNYPRLELSFTTEPKWC